MKKIGFITRDDEYSSNLETYLIEELSKSNFEITNDSPDLVIVIGGDGTFLRAMQEYVAELDSVKFCGINTGTLGFYSDFLAKEVDELIAHIKSGDSTDLTYHLIEAIVTKEHKVEKFLCLNEIRIENNLNTQRISVDIDGSYFETINGNGVCISTPSGSTAYNKSLQGAVVHPKTKAMQLVEIAAISNNKYRALGSPLILCEDHVVDLTSEDFTNIVIGVDNMNFHCKRVLNINIKLSKTKLTVARFRRYPFLDRVRDSFL